MERKVIQITAGPADDSVLIYAVCNDDSIWKLFRMGDGMSRPFWERLPDIPQPFEGEESFKRRKDGE
jgi:hypothetical protein